MSSSVLGCYYLTVVHSDAYILGYHIQLLFLELLLQTLRMPGRKHGFLHASIHQRGPLPTLEAFNEQRVQEKEERVREERVQQSEQRDQQREQAAKLHTHEYPHPYPHASQLLQALMSQRKQ